MCGEGEDIQTPALPGPRPAPRWRAPGLGGGDVQPSHRLLGALWGDGAALGGSRRGAGWEGCFSNQQIAGPRLLCRGWGEGGPAVRSACFVCPFPFSSPRPHPWPDSARPGGRSQRTPIRVWNDPGIARGGGKGEKPTAASRRVMGVEKDPEGRGAGGRAAGLPARPDKS